MHLGRHDLTLEEARSIVGQAEREALMRAEEICGDAEKMLRECEARCDAREREADMARADARAEAGRIKAQARAEVARLVRDAITLVDSALTDARDQGADVPSPRPIEVALAM